jgi:transcriptional regulator NrdR family protein
MICINCLHGKTDIYNSRPHKKTPTVWRRRKCVECGFSFTTNETVAIEGIYQVFVSGSRRKAIPFSRVALLLSLVEVLEYFGANRDDAYWLEQTIEQKIMGSKDYPPDKPLSTSGIASIAHSTLAQYNELAALAYAKRHGVDSILPKKGRPPRK